MPLNSNILIGIFIAACVLAVIFYINQSDDQLIHNEGVVTAVDRLHGSKTSIVDRSDPRAVRPPILDNRGYDDISNNIVDDLVAQYTVEDRPMEGGSGSFGPADPMSENHGAFDGYEKKKQLNMKKMETPYSDDEYDPRDFSYKKKKFTRRTPADVSDQFDINKMLPQEIEKDWYDVEPLLTTKKIKGTHLIHPKVHMGVNTVGSSHKNGSLDYRGDIPNPKINVSPWNNSTIDPDTNIKGICNPI